MFGSCFIMQYLVSFFSLQLPRGCFALLVFLLSCGCKSSWYLLYGALLYDCGISWSYSIIVESELI